MELCEFLDDGCGEDWEVGFLEAAWVCVEGFFFPLVSGCREIGVWGDL